MGDAERVAMSPTGPEFCGWYEAGAGAAAARKGRAAMTKEVENCILNRLEDFLDLGLVLLKKVATVEVMISVMKKKE